MTAYAEPFFPSPPDWRDIPIYQIFTDRFADGDPSNNELTPGVKCDRANPRAVHGGDFKGIEQHLDYIRGLGMRAIWITPVFLNQASSAWHGYGAIDFTTVSPQLGGLDGLRSLVKAAHARGMYVLIDAVVNHMGFVVTSDDPGWPRFRRAGEGYRLRWQDPKTIPPAPFNNLNWFHDRGRIEHWNDPVESVVGQFYTLADLRTELPEVRAALIRVYQAFIDQTDCDGFRVDTVRHVEKTFWEPWCTAMREHARALGKANFLMFGEVAVSDDRVLADYTGEHFHDGRAFDSLLDFPFYYAVREVVAQGKAATRRLTERFGKLTSPPYSREAIGQLVTFIDNHDQPRFLAKENADGDLERLKQALVLLYTTTGVPCMYYGTEQGFRGGHDPFNREDMIGVGNPGGATNHFDSGHELYRFVARLSQIRAEHPALRQGDQTVVADDAGGPGIYAFIRQRGRDAVLVILNTATTPARLPRNVVPTRRRMGFTPVLGSGPAFRPDRSGRLPGLIVPAKSAWLLVNAPLRR
ncbi:MAG: alpha-amylase family glycosyl hydrolase [Limisphaerales bacterium]